MSGKLDSDTVAVLQIIGRSSMTEVSPGLSTYNLDKLLNSFPDILIASLHMVVLLAAKLSFPERDRAYVARSYSCGKLCLAVCLHQMPDRIKSSPRTLCLKLGLQD